METNSNLNNEMKLNDVVQMYFAQYGVNYTVDHYIMIRQSYYDHKNTQQQNS